MEVACLVFSTLALVASLGSVLFSRLSKRLPASLKEFSEKQEAQQDAWRTFKRQMIDEWEEAHHKLRSLAGRIDQQKRRTRERAEQEQDQEQEPGNGLSDEAALNRELLRRRGINL